MPVARRTLRNLVVVIFTLLLVAILSSPVYAQTDTPEGEVNEAGRAVYDSGCFACHQPDGEGTSVFPPLYPNSNVEDTTYVEDVIRNGLTGEIEVGGVTYDSAMPPQRLSDDETAAVIDYIQNDLGRLPQAVAEAADEEGFAWGLVTLLALVSVLAVGIAYIAATPGGRGFTWARSWWLGIIVFIYFAIATVWLPDYVINGPALKSASGLVKDLAASGAWFIALAVGIYSVRWMQKNGRI